jgi:hypothetical protein
MGKLSFAYTLAKQRYIPEDKTLSELYTEFIPFIRSILYIVSRVIKAKGR